VIRAKRAVSISDPFVELKTKRSEWMRDPSSVDVNEVDNE